MSNESSNSRPDNPTRLGGFELLEQIGEGGMGVVYRAKQTSLDRLVALKVLNARLAADEKYLDSFRREARSAARLSHSNIIPVFDAGEADGSFYYAMEFVSGETLSKWVRREGALPETTSLEIALCVAGALKYAWEREQLIHRDIKPENIIIDTEGNVKICDLGLAKNFGENTLLSLSGQAFGTPNYMSPEQARADRSVDCRSDIYSLGLTLYFALTNEIPYHGGTATLVMARHMTEQLADPRTHAPNLSSFTCQLMEKMASRDVEDRYQTWDELIADLQLVRAGQPPTATPLPPKKSSIARTLSDAERLADMQARAAANNVAASVSERTQGPTLSPQPSGKSRTPIYVTAGVVLLALGGIGGWFAMKGGDKTQTPPTQPPVFAVEDPKIENQKPPDPPRPPPPVVPVITPERLAEAKSRMELARQFAETNPNEPDQIIAQFQAIADSYAGTPEASEALQLIAVMRARHERALRETRERQQAEERRIADQRAHEEAERAKALTIFSEVQKSFLAALAKRNYAEAEKTAQTAAENPMLASLKDRTVSFAEVAKRLRDFWSSLPQTLAPLKGKEITVQNETGNFDGISQGSIELEKKIGDSGAVVVDVALARVTAEELAALINTAKPNSETLLSLAWFLFAEGKPAEADKQFAAAEKSGTDVKTARELMSVFSKGVLEIEAEKILGQLRALVEVKRWQEARAALNLLNSQYVGTQLVASSKDEIVQLAYKVEVGLSPLGIAKQAFGALVQTIKAPSIVTAVAISPNGRHVIASGQGWCKLYDLATGKELREFDASETWIRLLKFTADGRYVVIGATTADRKVSLWDVASGKMVRSFPDKDAPDALAVSPDGKWVLSVGYGKIIRAWDIASGEMAQNFGPHNSAVRSLAFSGDGKMLVSGCIDGKIFVWDTHTGKQIRELGESSNSQGIMGTAILPDDRHLLAARNNSDLVLWDISNGRWVRNFIGRIDTGASVAVTPDGRLALSVVYSPRSAVSVWDIASGSIIADFKAPTSVTRCFDVSRDGKFVLTGSEDGSLFLWHLGDSASAPRSPNSAVAPVDTMRMPNGNFSKPKIEKTPQTFLKVVSTKGDYIGRGQQYAFGPDPIKIRGNEANIQVEVDRWRLQFAPPPNETLKVREYLDAKRAPFRGDSPGIEVSAESRGGSAGGKFVIWELEVKDGNVSKFAVDFVHVTSAGNPPLFGSLRYNSSYGDEPEKATVPSATLPAVPAPKSVWLLIYDQALAKAKREKKIVFVFFFKVPADAELRKMVEAVFQDPKMQERLGANFVAVRANVDGDGQALARKFDLAEFPQYWFFDDNGNKIYSASGYAPVDKIHDVLDRAMELAPAHLKPRADNSSAPQTIAGTFWRQAYSHNGRDYVYELLFLEKGVLRTRLEGGVFSNDSYWKQQGEVVTFGPSNRWSESTATIRGDKLEGSTKGPGSHWTWTAERLPNPDLPSPPSPPSTRPHPNLPKPPAPPAAGTRTSGIPPALLDHLQQQGRSQQQQKQNNQTQNNTQSPNNNQPPRPAAPPPHTPIRPFGVSVRQSDEGVQVVLVVVASDAAHIGVRKDDILTHVNDRPITTVTEAVEALRNVTSDTPVSIRVKRRSENLVLQQPRP